MTTRIGNICFKITIEATRHEQVVGGREWIMEGDPSEPKAYGYTPNIMEIKKIDRRLLSMTVATLDVPALIRAILKNSKPL